MPEEERESALATLGAVGHEACSLRDVASRMADEQDDGRRYKLALEFVRGYVEAPKSLRAGLIATPPKVIGDARWDALVAALADHYAFHDRLPQPAWTSEAQRFCFPPFSPAGGVGVRVMARVHAPAAFLRHGVLVMPEDLRPV